MRFQPLWERMALTPARAAVDTIGALVRAALGRHELGQIVSKSYKNDTNLVAQDDHRPAAQQPGLGTDALPSA